MDGIPGEDQVVPPPAVFEGPPAPPVQPPATLERQFAGVEPGPGVWAVVIGINDYPGRGHDLRWAGADADDMVAALRALGVPGDHIVSLRDGAAPAANVTLAADWLVAHAGKDATAVFAYSGHVRKLDTDHEAMVAADGNVVTDTDLAAHLAPLAAKRTWLSMEACFGGGFTEALGPGRVLTAAADADHLAYENSDLHRSYLGEFMIREALLQGKANGSVQQAFDYAFAAIHQRYPGREPFEIGDTTDNLDLRAPGAGRPATASAASAAAPASPGPPPPPPPAQRSAPPPSTTSTTAEGCSWATAGVVTCGRPH